MGVSGSRSRPTSSATTPPRQPDAEAEVDLMLGEYRKLEPGPLEEFFVFDHLSGYNRILTAMRWKAENLP